ncbi:MAG: GTP-binding protein [Candidatus Lokiarchaeota archaeon]|nr:GTP-binding protein [Candidatus Harpocratesius repetitus]
MSRRIKMTEDILQMMQNPEIIRNVGLIGHIDHGKTTLSDSLLAEAGLLSEAIAGEARVLDYLEEEQRRGITMKSANISLYYEHSLKESKPFLINLVDTPGHLDFSGKVTRALRLADGVVVIVDSVEEVSSQTETVVRQALEEAVRPILFINKIDRLFKELKLDMSDIKAKFGRIIRDFNKLITMYGSERAQKEWMVSAEKGSVIFGSALHRWGFVIPQLVPYKHNLEYFESKYEDNSYHELNKEYPVWECVLAAIVNFLPNPIEAQEYRIPTIWSGDTNSEIGKQLLKCDPKGTTIVFLSKVQKLKNRLIGTGRVFSGTLHRGQALWLVNGQRKSNLNQLSIFMGSRIESVTEIPAGNIVAIGGIKQIRSGETLFDSQSKENAAPFESVHYVSEPVVTVAIEPDMLKNLEKLQEILEEISIEDPNISVEISEDSGEVLLSGMGPLHLEIVANTIKERGVEVSVSKPSSVFHESVAGESSIITVFSPNQANNISLQIHRLTKGTSQYIRKVKRSILEFDYLREQELPKYTDFTPKEAFGIWNIDKYQNVLIVLPKSYQPTNKYNDSSKKITSSKRTPRKTKSQRKSKLKKSEEDMDQFSEEERKQVIKAVEGVCAHGKLAYEPISELKITIHELFLSSDPEKANYFEISTMIQDALQQAIDQAHPVLLEPIYTMLITTPEEYIGTVSSLISQNHGKILEISQDVYRAHITAKMSVRQSIEFAQEIRGATSGRVFWQNLFDQFAPIPDNQLDDIIKLIKFRKGLIFSDNF